MPASASPLTSFGTSPAKTVTSHSFAELGRPIPSPDSSPFTVVRHADGSFTTTSVKSDCRLPANVNDPTCTGLGGCILQVNYSIYRNGYAGILPFLAFANGDANGACTEDTRNFAYGTQVSFSLVPYGKAYLGVGGSPSPNSTNNCPYLTSCSTNRVFDYSILPVQCWQVVAYVEGFSAGFPGISGVLNTNQHYTVCV